MERRRFPAPQARNEDFEPSSAWGPLDILARKATESEDDNAMAYDMERPGFCRQHEPGTIPTLPPQPTPGPDIPREGTPATIDAMVLQDSRRYQLLLLDAPFSNSMFISGQISTGKMFP
jgi:hypothetical protein